MKTQKHYNINFDTNRTIPVRVVPHQEYADKMPTYSIIAHATGLSLESGLSLVEVQRLMRENNWELVVPN
tara:strand:- start:1115 stop:1324 length:210 start_codon:yes stop_codon:yes gene_type:complete